MRKRLRKKLRRGEFRGYGFAVAWQFASALGAQATGLFFDALLDAVQARGLTFGGGGGSRGGSGFVCKAKRGSATEEDRAEIAGWFRALEPALSATVGPLEDARQGPPQVTSVREWIVRGAEVIVMPPVRPWSGHGAAMEGESGGQCLCTRLWCSSGFS